MKFILAILEVEDLERSLEFYHGLLGLPVIEQFTNEKNGARIAMVGDKEHAHLELLCKGTPVDAHKDGGMAVSFAVDDAMAIIEKNGKAYSGPISPGPGMQFYFTFDPDGHRVQLQEQKHV